MKVGHAVTLEGVVDDEAEGLVLTWVCVALFQLDLACIAGETLKRIFREQKKQQRSKTNLTKGARAQEGPFHVHAHPSILARVEKAFIDILLAGLSSPP